MSAIRIARAATGRMRVAKFEGGYHGFSDGLHISAHSRPGLAGPDADPRPVAESGGIPDSIVDDVVVLVQNDLETSERILRANADDIACLILELQTGAGGLLALDDDFVAGIRELTRELGIVLIFDETITLRAGVGGLQADYGVLPDLTVMGKIIGGGLPLGAVGGSAELMDVLQDGRASISGTHHGHRLALVAGAACLEQLDEAAFAKLNGYSARILREVNEWSRSRGSRFAVWGRGFSHLAYGMLAEPGQVVRTHRDHLTKVDATATHIISLELAVRGFFPVHRGEFSLSLAMTDDDVRSFIDCVEQIVEELEG